MDKEGKKQTSIQINVRLDPDYLEALKELARLASGQRQCEWTIQDIIRESLEISFHQMARNYGYYYGK